MGDNVQREMASFLHLSDSAPRSPEHVLSPAQKIRSHGQQASLVPEDHVSLELSSGGVIDVLCSGGVDISLLRQLMDPVRRTPSSDRPARLTQAARVLDMIQMVCRAFWMHFRKQNLQIRGYPELNQIMHRRSRILFSGKLLLNRLSYEPKPRSGPSGFKTWHQATLAAAPQILTEAGFVNAVKGPRSHDAQLVNYALGGWNSFSLETISVVPSEFLLLVLERMKNSQSEYLSQWLSAGAAALRPCLVASIAPHVQAADWWCSEHGQAHDALQSEFEQHARALVSIRPFISQKPRCSFGVAREGAKLMREVQIVNHTDASKTVSFGTSSSFGRRFATIHNGVAVESLVLAAHSDAVLTLHARAILDDPKVEMDCSEQLVFHFKASGSRLGASVVMTVELSVMPRRHSFWLQFESF